MPLRPEGGTLTQDPPENMGPVPGATGPDGKTFAETQVQGGGGFAPAARDVAPKISPKITAAMAGVQTGPTPPDPAVARLEKVWDSSKSSLPTDVALALAQSNISDHEISRAAVHLARWYDVPPAYMLRPVSYTDSATGVPVSAYQDPATGQIMSLATARRVLRPEEPAFFAKALATYITGMGGTNRQVRIGKEAMAARGMAPGPGDVTKAVTPEKLARVVKAMRPVDGTQMDFTQAIGAAFSIVADGTNLKRFETNLAIAAKASGLTPTEQIAVAHDAAKKGLAWTDENQLLAYLNPTMGAAYSQAAPLMAQAEAILGQEKLFSDTNGAQGLSPLAGADQMNTLYANHPELYDYQRTYQGSSGHDYGAELRAALDSNIANYQVQASGIATAMQLDSTSFGHTFLGHVLHDANIWANDTVKGTFAGIQYAGGGIVTALATPFGAGGRTWDITYKDAQDIWHGNETMGSLLATAVVGEHGITSGLGLGTHPGIEPWIATGFNLYSQWYLSPDTILGRAFGYLHEADALATAGTKVDALLNTVGMKGLSSTGQLATWQARATDFVDSGRLLLGGKSLVAYTRDILLTSDNPEMAWARLRDRMWVRYGNGAVDSRVMNGLWSAAKVAEASGAPTAEIDQVIRDVWLAGFGAKPFTGSTAEAVLQGAANIDNPNIQQGLLDAISNATTEEKAAEALRAAEANAAYASTALDQLSIDYGLTSNGYLRRAPMLQEIPKISPAHDLAVAIGNAPVWDSRMGAAIKRTFTRLPGPIANVEDRYAQTLENYMRSAPTNVWSKEEIVYNTTIAENIANDVNAADRESKFLAHTTKVQHETIVRMGRSLGYSPEDALQIASTATKSLRKLNDNMLHDVYGVTRPEEGVVRSFDQPLWATQLLNTQIMVDPVTVYKTMAHHVGMAKRLDALALRSTMPGISELTSAAGGFGFSDLSAAMDAVKGGTTDLIDLQARLGEATSAIAPERFLANVSRLNKQVDAVSSERTIAGALSDTSSAMADAFNRTWKPTAVLRPSYILRGPLLDEQLRTFARIGFVDKVKGYLRPAVDAPGKGRITNALGLENVHPLQRLETAAYHVLPDKTYQISMAGVVEGLGKEVTDPLSTLAKSYGYQDLPAALDAVKQADELTAIGQDALAIDPVLARMAPEDLQALRDLAANLPRVIDLKVPGLLWPGTEQLANSAGFRQAFERTAAGSEREAARLEKGRGYEPLDPAAKGADQGFIATAWAGALNDQIGQTELGRYQLGQIQRAVPLEERVADSMTWLGGNEDLAKIANNELARMGVLTDEEKVLHLHKSTEVVDSYTQNSPIIARAATNHQVMPEHWATLENKPLVHGPRSAMDSGFKHPFTAAKDFGSKWLMEVPHDLINRQPFYRATRDAAGNAMLRQVAESGMTVTPEWMASVAQESRNFALGEVRRILIDYSQTNRIEDMLGFIAPFFKPWENALMRWGKLIADKPALLGYVRVLDQAGHESGFLRTDPQTGQTTIPLSWWMGAAPILQHMFGVGGWQLSAPLAGLNLMFSDTMGISTGDFAGQVPLPLPALGPAGLWTLQHILLNSHSPIPSSVRETMLPWALRYGQTSVSSLIPTWLKYALDATNPARDPNWMTAQTENFLKMQTTMGITAESLMADNPTWTRDQAQAKLVEMATTNARQYAGFRSFAAAFFPAAPHVSFPQQGLEDELGALIKANPTDIAKAYDIFNSRHPDMGLLTVSKTIVNTDNQLASPVRLPATDAFAKLMRQPGFAAFAKQYPQWLWAVIPPEVENGAFDPGVLFSQIADGLIRYRTPTELLQQGDLTAAWSQYWPIHNAWQAHSEALQAQGFSSTSDTFKQAKDAEYDQPLSQLATIYPVWGRNYGPNATTFTATLGLDPNVLTVARSLTHNPTFMNAPSGIGAALAAYLDLRDRVYAELRAANVSSITNADAVTLGLAKTYADGVQKIFADFPDSNFQQAYQAFFTKDLQQVTAVGTSILRQVGADPAKQAAFDAWNGQMNQLTQSVKQANLQGQQDVLYFQMNQLSDQAFASAAATGFNPQMVWWNTRTPGEKQTYTMGLYSRPYAFLSQFDRQVVLGDTVTAQSEAEWAQIGKLQTQIGLMGDQGKTGSSAIYAYIDKLAAGFAAKDPVFAQQMANANTWGYSFFHTTPYLDASSTTSTSWGAWKNAVEQVQTTADGLSLNGSGSFDAGKKAAYAYLKNQLITYLGQLETNDPQFAREVADIQTTNGSTKFVDYFMSNSNYPLGGFLPGGGAFTGVPAATP